MGNGAGGECEALSVWYSLVCVAVLPYMGGWERACQRAFTKGSALRVLMH